MFTKMVCQFTANGTDRNAQAAQPLFKIDAVVLPLREHLRTHETFTVDQIIRDFFRNYHQFSIKSYVVAIY